MRSALRPSGLALVAASILAPKVLLLAFAADRLWVPVGPLDAAFALAADALVATLVALVALAASRRGRAAVVALAVVSTLCVVLLLVDVRVRELWLRPLDLGIAAYGLRWSDDLSSSSGAFFSTQAGLGLTFRRAAALVVAAHAAGWTMLVASTAPRAAMPVWTRLRVAVVAAFAAVVVVSPVRLPYALESNALVTPAASALRDVVRPARADDAGVAFEQPTRPLSVALAAPRTVAAPRFRNAIVVHFESCRWRGLGFDDAVGTPAPTPAPNLRRLATEGALFRCRVPVPHSSKATFAMVTGLLPSLGIEIREAAHAQPRPLPAELARDLGLSTWAFSVQSLEFEGIGRMLANTGFERRLGPAELIALGGGDSDGVSGARSSFGEDDALLARGPASLVAADGRPFFALLLTASAHHPYLFPGKTTPSDDTWESYCEAIAYADRCLAATLADFDRRGLLDDTVVAIVGDHGESFGEHGTRIHNNSLFDEETTVPLVLWAKDGALRRTGTGAARQIDIAPTIADLLGGGAGAPVQGVSLLRDVPSVSFHASFFDGVAEALVDGGTKWIHEVAGGRLTRYDLAADPDEVRGVPVTDSAERAAVLARLAAFRAHQATLHGDVR